MTETLPPMAELTDVAYRYPGKAASALVDEQWTIEAGSFVLVVGRSGSGKSTLLRCLNGLVPHFSGGAFGGVVRVNGRDTRSLGPRDLSPDVGFVFQDPESQLVTDRVDSEIAFGLEQHGVDRITMRKRVEEALDYLGIEPLRHRRPQELSGGERQRVAIAAALASQPRLIVLDEPTSQLDPWSAEDVLTVLTRLNDDFGLTVVIAEHRLERLMSRADVVRYMEGGRSAPLSGTPREIAAMIDAEPLPPVTRLARELGQPFLPLTIKEARSTFAREMVSGTAPREALGEAGDVVTSVTGASVTLGGRTVLENLSMEIREGELVALMGRNGSGKTTLLRTIAGLQAVSKGQVVTCGLDMARHDPADLGGQVGYVPQQATSLFFREHLREELAFTGKSRRTSIDVEDVLRQFGLEGKAESHPLDLSGGERERAAMATVMARNPRLLLLDEPTRGMDAWRKHELGRHLRSLQARGIAVVMVTHDVELVAECASRVVMLGDREVLTDGSPRDVLTGSLSYTTQINKVFGGRWLTVEDIVTAVNNPS
jgi:energy-coupling factor transport system ATP-binding protein